MSNMFLKILKSKSILRTVYAALIDFWSKNCAEYKVQCNVEMVICDLYFMPYITWFILIQFSGVWSTLQILPFNWNGKCFNLGFHLCHMWPQTLKSSFNCNSMIRTNPLNLRSSDSSRYSNIIFSLIGRPLLFN